MSQFALSVCVVGGNIFANALILSVARNLLLTTLGSSRCTSAGCACWAS